MKNLEEKEEKNELKKTRLSLCLRHSLMLNASNILEFICMMEKQRMKAISQ